MLRNIVNPAKKIDLALSLAWDDVMMRFSRTVLGPFWIVISNIALIGGIAVVFGGIFNTPIKEYVIYVTIGIALWTFLSSVITGSTDYLKSGREMLFTYDLPWSIQIIRKVFVEAMVLFIHVLIAIPVIIFAQNDASWIDLVALLGVFMNIGFGLGLALIISSYGIRYQDLSHALTSVMLFLFLFTPVFWEADALGETRSAIIHYNPLFHFLEISRAPILYDTIPWESFAITGVVTVLTIAIGLFIYIKRRAQIGLWMQ